MKRKIGKSEDDLENEFKTQRNLLLVVLIGTILSLTYLITQ